MDLQLESEQDSSVHEVDCPPGFEVVRIELDTCPRSPLASSSSFVGEKSSDRNLLSTDTIYNGIENVLSTVECDLHSSAKMSLADYFETLVNKEVTKVVDSLKYDQLNEVIKKLLAYFKLIDSLHFFPKQLGLF